MRSTTIFTGCHLIHMVLVPVFLTVIPSVTRLQIREQIVNVPVLWFMEEIVEIVAGGVVCNARTGDRRQHG